MFDCLLVISIIVFLNYMLLFVFLLLHMYCVREYNKRKDIWTGKMIDGYSMLHGSSMATSKKIVYKGSHQLLYVLETLYVSITSIHIRPLEKVRFYMNLHSQYTYHPSLMGCINMIKSY